MSRSRAPGSMFEYTTAVLVPLLASIPLSALMLYITCPRRKQTTMMLIGLALNFIGTGYYVLLIISHAVIAIAMIKLHW